MTLCEQIKSRLTLRESAALCGVLLPERDGRKFCSPFRPDRTASCETHRDTVRDRSRGESFDAISLYATAKNLTIPEAVRALAQHLGIRSAPDRPSKSFTPKPSRPMTQSPHSRFKALGLHATQEPPPMPAPIPWTRDIARAIADSRGLPLAGIDLARRFGTLSAGAVHGFASWTLSDRSGLGWESRRLNAEKYPATADLGERKSHASGRIKSWPMGLLPPRFSDSECREHLHKILLCEGTPDYLAACCIAESVHRMDCQPVAMLGKSSNISPDAMPHFRGRSVTIACHSDAAQRAEAWGQQISDAGGTVKISQCPDGRDLCDLLSAGANPSDLYHHLFDL